MKHNKKWLALLLAACLCVTLLPMAPWRPGRQSLSGKESPVGVYDQRPDL